MLAHRPRLLVRFSYRRGGCAKRGSAGKGLAASRICDAPPRSIRARVIHEHQLPRIHHRCECRRHLPRHGQDIIRLVEHGNDDADMSRHETQNRRFKVQSSKFKVQGAAQRPTVKGFRHSRRQQQAQRTLDAHRRAPRLVSRGENHEQLQRHLRPRLIQAKRHHELTRRTRWAERCNTFGVEPTRCVRICPASWTQCPATNRSKATR